MSVSDEGEYGCFNGGSCLGPCLIGGSTLIFGCCGSFFFKCFTSDFSLCLVAASIRNVLCMCVSDEGEYGGFNGGSCLGSCLTSGASPIFECCGPFFFECFTSDFSLCLIGASIRNVVCKAVSDEGEYRGFNGESCLGPCPPVGWLVV